MHKKILIAFGITILFLGVGIQPAIATVEPQNIDPEFYDVNVEFCGLGKNHTIKLTQQQLDELDLLFENIREQLNTTESKEETLQIYNNAIVRLDSLGLLGDYSIKQVQKLILRRFKSPIFNNILERLSGKIQKDVNSNSFCQIIGKTTRTIFFPPSTMIFNKIFYFAADLIDFLNKNFPYGDWGYFITSFLAILWEYNTYRALLSAIFPLTFGSGIALGFYARENYEDKYYPATGWIHTNGTSGQRNWEGSFYGQICGCMFWLVFCFIGVNGFTGIKIKMDSSLLEIVFYYLGFANYVNIGYEPPPQFKDWL